MRFAAFLLLSLSLFPQAAAPVRRPNASMVELSRSFEYLATTATRAVVQVNATGYSIASDPASGRKAAVNRQSGTGSGVVVTSDGYIVTNAHVVQTAQRVTVVFNTGGEMPPGDDRDAMPARILGIDRETDIAVLKVDKTGLPHLQLANSDHVKQGQVVLALGSPLGLTNSLTMGVVSNTARQLSEEDFMQYIQTDAPINPGNSGGPLVDAEGRVVGINTLIYSQSGGSEGVGFAIPSNMVRNVYQQIKAFGRVRRGLVGVSVQNLNSLLVDGLSLPRRPGVLVADVGPGGPADLAGLKIGDLVLSVDHVPLRNARQLELRVFRSLKGQRLQLELLREDKPLTVEIAVQERPEMMDKLLTAADLRRQSIPQLGVLGVSITREIAAMLPELRASSGVLVAAVSPSPGAANIELAPGDVIHSFNGATVVSLEFLQEQLSNAKPGAAVVLQLERQGGLRYMGYRVE